MIVSRAMAWACLTFLGWTLLVVAGLLLILTGLQQHRGDGGAMPGVHLAAASIAAVIGWLCRILARRFA